MRLNRHLCCCLFLIAPLLAIAQADSSASQETLRTTTPDTLYTASDTIRTAKDTLPASLPAVDSIIHYRINGAYLNSFYPDLKYVVTRPAYWQRKDYIRLGIVTGTLGLLLAGDYEIKKFFRGNNGNAFTNVSRRVEPFGNTYGPFLIAGMYATGVVFHRRELEHASLMAAKSVIISTLLYAATKAVIRRQRPATTNDPFSFSAPFNGDKRFTSFPSGHMHTVTTIATALAEVYGKDHPWVPWVAYGLAGLTGISRLYDNRHWGSDVWIGASLGFFVTKAVFRHHRQLLKRDTRNQLVAP